MGFDFESFTKNVLNNITEQYKTTYIRHYKVDVKNGEAIEEDDTRLNRYVVFLDDKGCYIKPRYANKVYLTEKNSEVL